MWQIINSECLAAMAELPERSVDLVLTDPPYGTTACKWDAVIPFDQMWQSIRRVAKPDAAIVLFSSQPFTSALVMSNPSMFKYEWIWRKNSPTGHLNVKIRPMLAHESLVIFGNGKTVYNPQGLTPHRKMKRRGVAGQSDNYGKYGMDNWQEVTGYPRSVIDFDVQRPNGLHPTQKPVDLLRYFIRTYSNESDIVLDFTCGSGSTGVACLSENRSFIGIEQDETYAKVALERLRKTEAEITSSEPALS